MCSVGRDLLENWVQNAFACNNEIRLGPSDESIDSWKLIELREELDLASAESNAYVGQMY